METSRELLVSAVAVTKCRLKGDGHAALAAREELDSAMRAHRYLSNAPFKLISLIFRYGERDNMIPDIGRVDAKRGFLPVAVELKASRLQELDQVALTEEFRRVMIEVLCDVAANFDLPYQFLDDMRRS